MQYEIQNIVTGINIYHEITLVTVYNLPNRTDSVYRLFEHFSEKSVNIDMISLSPSASALISVAFTAEADSLERIFKAIGEIKKEYSDIRTEVVPERCKIIFSGKEIAERIGTAAYIFKAFEESGIAIDIITTSHKEISCLINSDQTPAAKEMLKKYFGVQSV